MIGLWCNGSTTGFGSVCPGSNPGSPTNKKGGNESFLLFCFLSLSNSRLRKQSIHQAFISFQPLVNSRLKMVNKANKEKRPDVSIKMLRRFD